MNVCFCLGLICRATSTTNVMSSSVQGRATVTDNGAATSVTSKRASSVFGLDLNQGDATFLYLPFFSSSSTSISPSTIHFLPILCHT